MSTDPNPRSHTADLLGVLGKAGLDLTPLEIAEALWLARHAQPPRHAPGIGFGDPGTDGAEVPDDATATAELDQRPQAGGPAPVGLARLLSTGTPTQGYLARASQPPGLADRAGLQRALRPFKRRHGSRHRSELDESATTRFIAETKVWRLVTRPVPERWFEVAVVVDTSTSMLLWQPLATDLTRVLTQTGAFRDVRTWQLTANGHVVSPGGARSHPARLVDPAGRRLIIVISDGAAASWYDGTFDQTIGRWAAAGPLAVLQPLPERMWTRTGLRPRPGRFRSSTPATRTTTLRFEERRRDRYRDTPRWVLAVPVLRTEPSWLAAWARLLTSGAAAGVDLPAMLVTTPVDVEPPAMSPEPAPAESAPESARDRVRRFRATASPDAYQLAVCLSLVPLSVPVMRLVQHAVNPAAASSTVAEVVLGGFVEHVEGDVYEFLPGVRETLLPELRRSETAVVISAVGKFLTERVGRPGPTFQVAALSEGREDLRVQAEPFAWMPPAAAALVAPLATTPPTPTSPPASNRTDTPGSLLARAFDSVRSSSDATASPDTGAPPEVTAGFDVPATRTTPRFSSPRRQRPDLDPRAPLFFISYARTLAREPNRRVSEFFDDLSDHVQELVGGHSFGAGVGFLDRSLRAGNSWSAERAHAVGTCQIFVPLLSPGLFRSEWCGREWDAFSRRRVIPAPAGTHGETAILPVVWSPTDSTEVPAPVRDIQRFSPQNLPNPETAALYQREGIYGLMVTRLTNAYQEVVWRLAQRIVKMQSSLYVEPNDSVDFNATRNVFGPEPTN